MKEQELTLSEYVSLLPEDHKARKQYNKLLESVDWLYCLEEAGVDNWEGFATAKELKNE